MEYKKIIEKLKNKVENYFSKDASGHNIGHLTRTLNNAVYIQSKEGGDIVVIAIAAFIHDIHRIMSTEQNRHVSPLESMPVVNEFIKDLPITENQKKHICHAIEHHEEYSFGKDKVSVNDIESLILQDADNLDAIGAIGIARTFVYGAAHNRVEYDPNEAIDKDEYYEGKKKESSTINHFHEKLFKLRDNMNTKTGKKLADDRTLFMHEFVERYVNEWNGKFEVEKKNDINNSPKKI